MNQVSSRTVLKSASPEISTYLQLVGLSFGFAGVPDFGGWWVSDERRWGRGRVLAAACLQTVSHCGGGL